MCYLTENLSKIESLTKEQWYFRRFMWHVIVNLSTIWKVARGQIETATNFK